MDFDVKKILFAIVLVITLISFAATLSHAAQCFIELPYINLVLDEQGTVCELYYDGSDKVWWDGILKIGDKIIKLNGMNISTMSPKELEGVLYGWGRTVTNDTITLKREGTNITVSLDEKRMARHWWYTFVQKRNEIEEQTAKIALRLVITSSPSYEGIGIKFSTDILNPSKQQRRPGYVSAVVIKPGYPSPARDQGIKPGDRIAAINDIKIPVTMDRFEAAYVIIQTIANSSGPVKLIIERDTGTFEATVQKTKISNGAGERFFRNRVAIQKLDEAAQSLDRFESILFNWMKGETKDAFGNDLTYYFANMHFYIATNLNLFEVTRKDMQRLDRKLSWWSETDCLFLEDSSCDN